jgi:dTDP-4-dehydrorhamnose reductase
MRVLVTGAAGQRNTAQSAADLLARDVDIVPIGADEYSTPAVRPPYSVLEKGAMLAGLQLEAIHWPAALRSVIEEPRS